MQLALCVLCPSSSLRTASQTSWFGCCKVTGGWPTTASQHTRSSSPSSTLGGTVGSCRPSSWRHTLTRAVSHQVPLTSRWPEVCLCCSTLRAAAGRPNFLDSWGSRSGSDWLPMSNTSTNTLKENCRSLLRRWLLIVLSGTQFYFLVFGFTLNASQCRNKQKESGNQHSVLFSSSTRTRPALPLWAVGELQVWRAQSSVMSQVESDCPKRASNRLLAGPGQGTGSSAQKRRKYVFVCVVAIITSFQSFATNNMLRTFFWDFGSIFLKECLLFFF